MGPIKILLEGDGGSNKMNTTSNLRSVLEAAFILLESPSPSRRIFIGSHSLPPLWFTVSVLHRSVLLNGQTGTHGQTGQTHQSNRVGAAPLRLWFFSLGFVD
jgi:hypothetical protein